VSINQGNEKGERGNRAPLFLLRRIKGKRKIEFSPKRRFNQQVRNEVSKWLKTQA
jgi:hypothetical protein